MTTYWKSLLPGMNADRGYQLHSYPSVLESNKALLHGAFDASTIPETCAC